LVDIATLLDVLTRRSSGRSQLVGGFCLGVLQHGVGPLCTCRQYELLQAHPEETHLSLYRGINRIDEHEILETLGGGRYRVLFNNLNSFTSSRERADEFGDYILVAEVPLPKVFFFNRLLPGMLKGEDEFVVVGGVYEVNTSTL
jgi:NAD+--dinitrogen-reductase ADP-D-ribosyltransferase